MGTKFEIAGTKQEIAGAKEEIKETKRIRSSHLHRSAWPLVTGERDINLRSMKHALNMTGELRGALRTRDDCAAGFVQCASGRPYRTFRNCTV